MRNTILATGLCALLAAPALGETVFRYSVDALKPEMLEPLHIEMRCGALMILVANMSEGAPDTTLYDLANTSGLFYFQKLSRETGWSDDEMANRLAPLYEDYQRHFGGRDLSQLADDELVVSDLTFCINRSNTQ